MIDSLKAATGRAHKITPEHCSGFVKAWQRDRTIWSEVIDGLPSGSLISGLRYLRLWGRSVGEIDGRAVGPGYGLRFTRGPAGGVPTALRADRRRTPARR